MFQKEAGIVLFFSSLFFLTSFVVSRHCRRCISLLAPISLLHYFFKLFFSTPYLFLHSPFFLQLSKFPCFCYHIFLLLFFPALSYPSFDNNYTSPDTSLLSWMRSFISSFPSSFLSTHVSATSCFLVFLSVRYMSAFYNTYGSIGTGFLYYFFFCFSFFPSNFLISHVSAAIALLLIFFHPLHFSFFCNSYASPDTGLFSLITPFLSRFPSFFLNTYYFCCTCFPPLSVLPFHITLMIIIMHQMTLTWFSQFLPISLWSFQFPK